MNAKTGAILVVDDNEDVRDLLGSRLELQGYAVDHAGNGREALEKMQSQAFDLVLLDIMMPKMNGYQVLERLRQDDRLRHIPVLVISALDELDSVVKCIELGAADYLFKPFNSTILKARVDASLEKKRWRDQERDYLRQIEAERARAERLLLNILPQPIAERLKRGEALIADHFAEVTVLFADLVDFTPYTASMPPSQLIQILNEIFSCFDRLADKHGLEKIKTNGDSYMAVGGLPTPQPDHAQRVAAMALAMQQNIAQFRRTEDHPLAMRIGIHTGPVVAGVIGKNKISYDLWGDTVNTASRMESHGMPGRIQTTAATYAQLNGHFRFQKRGDIEIKGKGQMTTYFLLARR